MLERCLRLALPGALVTLSACGSYNLYDVSFETLLVDENDEPIREREYTLCPEFVFDDGEVLTEDCEVGFTDRAGIGTVGTFFQDLKELAEVRATLEVEGTQADGGVLSFESSYDDPDTDVSVDTRFSVPRSVLPTMVTRFDLVGSVAGDRKDQFPQLSGTLTLDIVLPDGLGEFSGTGPVTTDKSAVYAASIEVTSNYAFPIVEDAVQIDIDIDGYSGPGFLDLLGVEGDDPRIVTGFASF